MATQNSIIDSHMAHLIAPEDRGVGMNSISAGYDDYALKRGNDFKKHEFLNQPWELIQIEVVKETAAQECVR